MLQVAGDIVRTQGVGGLWAATGATCLRVGLGAGLYFLFLDKVRGRKGGITPTWDEGLYLSP